MAIPAIRLPTALILTASSFSQISIEFYQLIPQIGKYI